jgi:hypothetical protein
MMALLLDHSSLEIVLNVCGVLMNIVADPSCREFVSKEGAIDKYVGGGGGGGGGG